jgi:hypothetical protein
MKKSFSIMETLISVMLLSVTITALLQTKDNNLFILSSINDKNSYDGYISIHSVSDSQSDENINFNSFISLSDEDLRDKLNDQRVKYKKELRDKIQLKENDIDLNFEIYQEIYTNKELGKKSFYRVQLND